MDIARLRLANQHISGNKCGTVQEVVRSLGAVQAQDYGQSLWALGLRVRGAIADDVAKALQGGVIMRTWIMRGTLHYILPEDVGWMLKLLASRTVAKMTPKVWQYHATDEKMMALAERTFVKELAGRKTLTRKSMIELLQEVGIPNDRQQSYFIFGYLCQTGVLCPGPPQGKEQTFALLDDWAPDQRQLTYEESLAELAQRFFPSHGPATVADFANWAGIKIAEAKIGLESCKDSLVQETVGDREYWLRPDQNPGSGMFLLPGYDELLIGYKERDASFEKYGTMPISTYNGMFYATLVDDGQVAGLWKRVLKKKQVDVELRLRRPLDLAAVEAHAEELGRFLGLPARVIVKDENMTLDTRQVGSWR